MKKEELELRPALHIEVDCAPGHRSEKIPKRLHLGSRVIECLEIVDRWHGRDHHYFKVRANEGELYIVRLDTQSQQWELTLFSSEQYLTGKTPSANRHLIRQYSVS